MSSFNTIDREADYDDLGQHGFDPPYRFNPVNPRHIYVHQDDIWLYLLSQFASPRPVFCLADYRSQPGYAILDG